MLTPAKIYGNTQYFDEPQVALIKWPNVHLDVLQTYFDDYGSKYLLDPTELTNGVVLAKFAGQICYNAIGEKRTKNINAEGYIDHIKSSKHGSVLEHCDYTFFLYGVSRAFTHELVRHRAGFGYSQLSQRYVDQVRFVEPDPDAKNKFLHEKFLEDIVAWQRKYEYRVNDLMLTNPRKEGESATDYRKRINSDARTILPNCTETQIVVSANARALHHLFLMRAEGSAWIEARKVVFRMWEEVMKVDPLLFQDFKPEDGFKLKPTHIKV